MKIKQGLFFFAWVAAVWAFIFAAISFYWAAGGTIGAGTLGDTIESMSDSPLFLIGVWGTGLLKVAAGLLALSLIYKIVPFGSQRLKMIGVTGAGIICLAYGVLNMLARLIMYLGIIPTPEAMYSTAAQWHLYVWNPWWILGGILFLLASYFYVRTLKRI